jgi:hypothetical protein
VSRNIGIDEEDSRATSPFPHYSIDPLQVFSHEAVERPRTNCTISRSAARKFLCPARQLEKPKDAATLFVVVDHHRLARTRNVSSPYSSYSKTRNIATSRIQQHAIIATTAPGAQRRLGDVVNGRSPAAPFTAAVPARPIVATATAPAVTATFQQQ